MRRIRFLIAGISVFLFGTGQMSHAAFYVQSVTNNTPGAANDISVTWPQAVKTVQVQDPTKTKFNATSQNTGKTWAIDQTQGMSVPAGQVANIRWGYAFSPPVKISGGNWTNNGANVGAIVPGPGGNVIGVPVKVTANTNTQKMDFEFVNDEAVAVNYTNVNIWVDNSAANFTIDAFDTPTGTKVENNFSFSLGAAGSGTDTLTLEFSYLDPSGYGLVSSVVTEPVSGTNSFMESAEQVPEPAALALAAVALGFAGLRRPRTVR